MSENHRSQTPWWQSAEDYHQQYFSDGKSPYGYCPDHGTGVACLVGVVHADG